MKLGTLLVCGFLLALSTSAAAQTAAQRNQQSVLLLEKSLTLLTRGGPIRDVTMSGNVRYIAGSLNESGNATLEGTATGESRIDLTLPSGDRQQVRDVAAGSWTGSWSDKDGAWHSVAPHNLWTDPTWYFPAFLMGDVVSNAGYEIAPARSQTVAGSSAAQRNYATGR